MDDVYFKKTLATAFIAKVDNNVSQLSKGSTD